MDVWMTVGGQYFDSNEIKVWSGAGLDTESRQNIVSHLLVT